MAAFDKGSGGGVSGIGANPMWKKPAAPKPPAARPAPSRGPNPVWVRPSAPHPPMSSARGRTPSNGNSSRSNSYRAPARNNSYRPSVAPRPTVPRPVAPRPPVGNTPTGVVAKSVPPPPPPMSIDQYLAQDTAYGSQKNAYQKALADYAAQMQGEQGKYNGEYEAQLAQLGKDRTEGLTSLKDDFASRGLAQSGVYADALGQFNQKFDTSQADLERAKQAYMSDLTTGQQNFQQTQATLLEKARQDALNRRLDSLKV